MRIESSQVSRAFGYVLREKRCARGISQEELSKRARVDRTFISLIERGMRQATLTTLFKLANALGIRAETLVVLTERLLQRAGTE
jgi:transcriptional regulator with XRE-family HTH domain